MPTEKIKRFEISELILHWMQAVPLLLLIISGAVMLATRTSIVGMEREALETVVSFHKAAATAWLVLTLTSFITNGIRANLAILKEAHVWRPYDFSWIFASIAKLLHPGVKVPPAGKFNAGQKLNILGVAFLFIIASASGFMMWTHNTSLAAWYVHIACFCMAVLQVSVHIFMATIAPSTRIALGGIFHGWVPAKYIHHHHLLTLPPEERAAHLDAQHAGPSPAVVPRIILCAILFACFVAAGVAYRSTIPPLATIWGQFNERVVMPGTLYLPHRDKVATGQCLACHSLTTDMQSDKCLACHEKIADRMENSVGYHGTFSGPCIACHTEHMGEEGPIQDFVEETFNHDLAAFRLTGKHKDIACKTCHQKTNGVQVVTSFIGHPHESCTACHEDPHSGALGGECTTCHSSQGWKGRELLFDHNVHSSFTINALHASVACADCHKDKNFKPMKTTCVACHTDYADAMQGRWDGHQEKPDAHAGLVKCVDCHTMDRRSEQDRDFRAQCARCHHDGYARLYSDLQNSVISRQTQLQRALQLRAREAPNSQDPTLSDLSRQLTGALKVGPHNFRLAHALLDDVEQGLSKATGENE